MREWFIVGLKLLGILFLYSAITSVLSSIGLFLSLLASGNSFLAEESSIGILLASAFAVVAEIGCAFLLLFKAEWIAGKVNVLTGKDFYSFANGNEILQTGIILIGIYIFTIKIGWLVKAFALRRQTLKIASPFAATQPAGLTFSHDFIEPCTTIIISLCLIFSSKNITAFLTRNSLNATKQANHNDS
jgi:hypothetical protein